MNRQQARIEALRNIVEMCMSGMRVALWTEHSETDGQIIAKERADILNELTRRADRIEANLAIKPKRIVKR